MLEPGTSFPDFDLPDQDGRNRTLAELADGAGLVLFVYPKDDTPGCTTEAKDFRDRLEDFSALGYRVVGLSKDPASSHARFIEKHSLGLTLLSDVESRLMAKIGAWGEKKLYGRTSVGVIRSTFVIDREGKIVRSYRNVRAKGHAERVLRELRAIGA